MTIHVNGIESPYWKLGYSERYIFEHPTLQELKISCMTVPHYIIQDVRKRPRRCSPLTTLILEECNICVHGLKELLSSPKALETLHLGENRHNIGYFDEPIPPGSNNLFARTPDLAMEALKLHKHSLKSLTYATGPAFGRRLPDVSVTCILPSFDVQDGFSDFHSLQEVTLVGYCPAFELCLMSPTPPPNLERLAVKAERLFVHLGGSYGIPRNDSGSIAFVPFLRIPAARTPERLKEMKLTYTDRIPFVQVKDFVEGNPFVKGIVSGASKMGVNLRFFATCDEGPQWLYPPYLYGEKEPEEQFVLDGKLLQAGDNNASSQSPAF